MKKAEFNEKLLSLTRENPSHELMFLVSDDCCEFNWNVCDISDIRIDRLALFKDEQWLDEEDYEERLYCELENEYVNEDELRKLVDCEMGKVEFQDYICVYLT